MSGFKKSEIPKALIRLMDDIALQNNRPYNSKIKEQYKTWK